jgi:hypothetical protein
MHDMYVLFVYIISYFLFIDEEGQHLTLNVDIIINDMTQNTIYCFDCRFLIFQLCDGARVTSIPRPVLT